MKQPLVSIVVPVYNVEKYLDRCIKSIVNQSYDNLEILLIDDGSPDACPEMCDTWAERDPRIRVIHKQNQGLGMARNTGMEYASGSYICFLDSDDYVDGDMVQKCVAQAQKNRAEIVVFGMESVNKRGELLGNHPPEADCLLYSDDAVQSQFLPDLIDCRSGSVRIRHLSLSACSCMFSMELINRTNWRFVSERQIISEDSYSLIWLYHYVKRVAIIPENLYYYCTNEASLTRSYREDRFWKVKQFYEECYHMAKDLGYEDNVLSCIDGLFLSFTITTMKQIVSACMGLKDKADLIGQIVEDSTMRKLVGSDVIWTYNRQRRILLWSIRNRRTFLLCLLLIAQLQKDRLRGKI